jgi:hypothetical protein
MMPDFLLPDQLPNEALGPASAQVDWSDREGRKFARLQESITDQMETYLEKVSGRAQPQPDGQPQPLSP